MITKLIIYDLILKTIVITDTEQYIFQVKRQNIVSVINNLRGYIFPEYARTAVVFEYIHMNRRNI